MSNTVIDTITAELAKAKEARAQDLKNTADMIAKLKAEREKYSAIIAGDMTKDPAGYDAALDAYSRDEVKINMLEERLHNIQAAAVVDETTARAWAGKIIDYMNAENIRAMKAVTKTLAQLDAERMSAHTDITAGNALVAKIYNAAHLVHPDSVAETGFSMTWASDQMHRLLQGLGLES